ncbi:MAG: RDD family protein [Pseudomonadales bacterium]|nr:RDD family protein [Pseudomonadales bacterium]
MTTISTAYESPLADVTPASADTQYMGFWLRVLASILVNLWLGLLMAVVIAAVMLAVPLNAESLEMMATSYSIQMGLPALLVIGLWCRYASTPGKMAFKAKIVDADTLQPVANGRLAVRYFAYLVSLLPLGLGFLWVAWDARKQGFHDKIAGTVVIMER